MKNAGSAQVFSLVYLSAASRPLESDAVDEIALVSALINAEIDITGYLTYSDPFFTQYLEGPKDVVRVLLEKIRGDQRHNVTQVVELGESARRFPDWSMRLLDPLWHGVGGPLETILELLTVREATASPGEAPVEALRALLTQVSQEN